MGGWLVLALALGGGGEPAEHAEPQAAYVIVREKGHDDSVTFSVLTEEEWRGTEEEVRREEAAFSRAITMAAREWKKDRDNAGRPFPVSAIGHRQVRLVGGRPFSNESTALERLKQVQQKYDEDAKARAKSATAARPANKKTKSEATMRREDAMKRARLLFLESLSEVMEAAKARAEEPKKTAAP
jgi:hypothetical protein